MALARDLSDLPTPAASRSDGFPPDATPRFVQVLAEAWMAADDGPKPRAHVDSRFRHSDAGKCARAIAFAALDLPDSNPMDVSGWWNTGLGTLIHEAWQAALRRRYPAADIEPKVRTDAGSGHIDAVITADGKRIAYELKTTGGFAFKLAVGERGAAQGPKHEHIVQAALNGLAVNADEVVIGYLSKEAISVAAAGRKGFSDFGRVFAEWTLPRDAYMPVALAEIARVQGILNLLDEGTLPARKIPDPELPAGHVVTDPRTGQWAVLDESGGMLDAGSWWACAYCRWQDTCATTSAGRAPLSEVAVHLGGAA